MVKYFNNSHFLTQLNRKQFIPYVRNHTLADEKNKLMTSGLKNHLLRGHASNTKVRAAYLLDEVVDATP